MAIRKKRILAIVFMSSCAIFSLALLLPTLFPQMQHSLRLLELSAIPINLGLFLIPAEILLGIFYCIRYRHEPPKRKRLQCVLSAGCVLLLGLAAFSLILWANSHVTSGVMKDIQLYSANGETFVLYNGQPIQLTKEQSGQITDTGMWYAFEFTHNDLFPNQYTMTSFRLDA